MKLEINIDENFLQSTIGIRNNSFKKFLDIFKKTTESIYTESKTRYPTNILDNKLIGNEFARLFGLPTAKIIQVWEVIDKIKFTPNTVVKPVSGSSSKGVFVVYDENEIVYLNNRMKFSNALKARDYAKSLMTKNVVRRDRWMSEELLIRSNSIARDVKFYVFYGRTGLILETERISGIKRCWYDEDLNYVETGKYLNNSFKGSRDSLLDLKKIAENLSLEIPTPFLRIDFLISNNSYYLGEFTPVPANYDTFTTKWDFYLGELYSEAIFRICSDVANGKIFSKYNQLEKNWSRVLEIVRSRSSEYY